MNIFVGGLPFKVDEQELREIFEKYGEPTSVKLIIDKQSGRSKGFGFVEMDDEAGQQAIEALDGTELYGRKIGVRVSEEKKPDRRF
ncbi:RNA-binding protein [Daejeonella sp. H1SJ63]|jgi:RNA recognition motif-containing protein|uniref:RNA recognition motif domain-containing protein n=1 Tax=Daejeonella sp. H1SJ63 TaxID=3034145 RepID=UPI0023EA92DD|nr:RNA-binding protein [Daejeonella sp. H1SJ63]